MKKTLIGMLAATAMLASAAPALSQPVAEKRENTTTYATYMVTLKFAQAGAFDERINMLNEARMEAGMAPMQVHHVMGAGFDRMVVVPIAEGMAALDWEQSPSGAKVDAIMIEKMGQEEFQKWQMGWVDVSERPKVVYSHVHND